VQDFWGWFICFVFSYFVWNWHHGSEIHDRGWDGQPIKEDNTTGLTDPQQGLIIVVYFQMVANVPGGSKRMGIQH